MSAFQIFTQPSQQALDTAANVLPGATLTFSLTGTSTPTNAYSDAALTTPVANPLSANSAGVWAPVFLDPSVSYRVVLKTQAGAVLQTWDPANENVLAYFLAVLTASYLGGILYPRTAAESAASVTPSSTEYPADDPRRLASFYPNRGWLDLGDVPTYINNTAPGGSFSVPGDRTSVYVKGRRVRLINSNATSADVRITFSSFAAGITTINVTTADGGGTVSSTMVAVEVQDTCPAYGQLSNVLNYAGVAGAQFFNTDTGATSGARVIIGNVATDGAGAPDTSVSSAIAIVATGGNFSGSYLSNGVAGVPTGRGIWYHTGFPIPLCFGIGDQVRVVMQALGNPFLFLGAGEGFRIVSDRSDNLGGSSFSFFRTNASTRKGYMGFADNGTDNRMDIVNEESGSNVKIGSQQDIWLSPAATGKVYLDNSGGVFVKVGSGSPESVVTAPVGSLFLRTDGGATTTLYVKTSGSGNTGWTAK